MVHDTHNMELVNKNHGQLVQQNFRSDVIGVLEIMNVRFIY